MEALFLLLGELIVAPLTLMAAFLAEGVAACATAFASFLESVFGIRVRLHWKRKKSEVDSSEALEAARQRAARRLRLMKRLSVTLAGVLAVLVGGVLILNYFFFESVLRWGLVRAGERSRIQVDFQSATGNLFTGRFALKDATAVRQGSPVSNFDLQADELQLDISMLHVVPFSGKIEEVFIKDLKGDFHRLTAPGRMDVRKHYEVEHFRLEDIEIRLEDHTKESPLRVRFVLNELDSQPLRSRFAIFDLLFRSNASGEIDGKPFLIEMEKLPHGRRTQWRADGLPVAFVGHYLGGPFAWLSDGTVDVHIEDEWEIGDSAEINMRWRFVLRDLTINAPEEASIMSRLSASAIGEYMRRNAEKLDVTFSLTMNENQFEGTASAGAAGLWDAARDGFVREIAALSGAEPAKVEQGIQTGIDAFKDYLDQRRK